MSEEKHGEHEYKEILVRHWIEKARNDLESARANYQAGRFSNAVRDIYFASPLESVESALFPHALTGAGERVAPLQTP